MVSLDLSFTIESSHCGTAFSLLLTRGSERSGSDSGRVSAWLHAALALLAFATVTADRNREEMR